MSNQYYINTNEVKNTKTNEIHLEIEIFDNYGTGSVEVEEAEMPETDIEALQYLKEYGSDESDLVGDVVDGIQEYSASVTINDTSYSWDEIKHIFFEDENDS